MTASHRVLLALLDGCAASFRPWLQQSRPTTVFAKMENAAVFLILVVLSGLFFKLAVWAFAPRSPNGFFRAAVVGTFAPFIALFVTWLSLSQVAGWIGPFAWFVAIPAGILAGLTLITVFYGMSTFRSFFVASLYAMLWFLTLGVLEKSTTPLDDTAADTRMSSPSAHGTT